MLPGTIGEFTTTGGAAIHLTPRAMALTGPAIFSLTGTFTLHTAAQTTTVHAIHFGPGPFQLQLTAADHISGLMQGPYTPS